MKKYVLRPDENPRPQYLEKKWSAAEKEVLQEIADSREPYYVQIVYDREKSPQFFSKEDIDLIGRILRLESVNQCAFLIKGQYSKDELMKIGAQFELFLETAAASKSIHTLQIMQPLEDTLQSLLSYDYNFEKIRKITLLEPRTTARTEWTRISEGGSLMIQRDFGNLTYFNEKDISANFSRTKGPEQAPDCSRAEKQVFYYPCGTQAVPSFREGSATFFNTNPRLQASHAEQGYNQSPGL